MKVIGKTTVVYEYTQEEINKLRDLLGSDICLLEELAEMFEIEEASDDIRNSIQNCISLNYLYSEYETGLDIIFEENDSLGLNIGDLYFDYKGKLFDKLCLSKLLEEE